MPIQQYVMRLLVSCAALTVSLTAFAETQIFFDSSGSDAAAYGANEIITISGGLTFYGRSGGCRSNGVADIFGTAADVYVINHGTAGNGIAPFKLSAVTGAPHTISSFGLGGGFFEQVIGATQPGGSLPPGSYDLVVDECQDGYFDPDKDTLLGGAAGPAFTVTVPQNVPALPSDAIVEMKAQALLQMLRAMALDAAFKKIEEQFDPEGVKAEGILKGSPLALLSLLKPKLPLIYAILTQLRNKICETCKRGDEFMALPFKATETAISNQVKKYTGIAADPADPDYQELVLLEPSTPIPATDPRPIFQASAALGNNLGEETRLAGALLTALEKYQGAQQARDAYWALSHAREIESYAGLLADQLERSGTAWMGLRTAVTNEITQLNDDTASLQAFQAELRASGFSIEQQRYLVGMGMSGAAMEALRQELLQKDYSFAPSDLAADLQAQAQTAANAAPGYRQLSVAMAGTVTSLLSLPVPNGTQPSARFSMTQATVNSGTAVRFDAGASTDPLGLALSYDWDRDGNGFVADADGSVATNVFSVPFSGHVGLRVNNAGALSSATYAYLQTTNGNLAPVLVVLEPTNGVVTVAPGETVSFTAQASDTAGDTLTYQWLNESNILVGAGTSLSFSPGTEETGAHSIVVRVSDGRGGVATHFWLVGVVQPALFADLAVSQIHQPSSPQPGKDIVHTITVTNHGPDTAESVWLTNSLPGSETLVSASSSQGAVTVAGQQMLINVGQLTNGGVATVTIVASAVAPGWMTNQVTVTANVVELNAADNSSDDVVRVVDNPGSLADLRVSAVAAPNPVAASNILTYQISIRNLGPNTATGVLLTEQLAPGLMLVAAEPLPAGVNGRTLTLNFGTMLALGSASATISVMPTNPGTVTSVTSIQGDDAEPDYDNNQVVLTTEVLPTPVAGTAHSADLGLVLTASTNEVSAGEPFTYTLVITNAGPDAASAVTLVDNLDPDVSLISVTTGQGTAIAEGGIVTASIGALVSGGTAQVALVAKARFAGPVANRARVTAVELDPNQTDNTASLTIQASFNADEGAATVAVVRNFADPEIVTLQEWLAEMGLVSRAFDQEGLTFEALKTFRLIIWDDLSWGAGGIAPHDVDVYQAASDSHIPLYFIGDDLALSATYALEGTPQKTNWVNLIHLRATTENYGGNRTFSIVKTTHPVADGPYGVPGDSTYGYDPDNTTHTETGEVLLGISGPADVLVAYKDPVTKTKSVTQNVLPTITTDAAGVAEKRKLFKNAVDWLLRTDPVCDLTLAGSSVQPTSSAAGQLLTFRVAVRNDGPDECSNAVLTDILPLDAVLVASDPQPTSQAGNMLTFDLRRVPSANAYEKVITLVIQPTQEGSVTNAASVFTFDEDPNPGNNEIVQAVGVTPPSPAAVSLSLLQAASTETPSVQENFGYTLTASNAGPATASRVIITDALPGGVSVATISTTRGTAGLTNGMVVAFIGTLAPGETAQVTFAARSPVPGTLLNRATVSASEVEADPADNSSQLEITVRASAGPNDALTYQSAGWHYRVLNSADAVPAGFEQPDFDDSGWSRGASAFGIRGLCPAQATVQTTWPIGTRLLARHDVSLPCSLAALRILVTANNALEGVFFNGVRVQPLTFSSGCPVSDHFQIDVPLELVRPGQNTVAYQLLNTAGEPFFDSRISAETTGSAGGPEISVSAAAAAGLVVGTSFPITLTVSNSGPGEAHRVRVIDVLPNGFEAASATVTQGSVVLSGDTMTAVLDGLTNGEAATITLVAVPRQPGSFVNTIRAKSADCETKLQNNEVLQRLRVSLPASDLALSGSPTLPLLAKGALVAYEYRVENKGPQAAHALNFQDTLPAGLLLISAEGTKGTVAANGNSVHCQLVSLAAGASFSIKVVAQVAAAGSLTNVASIAAASSDPDPGNNTVTQSITGAAPSEVADLSVNIRGPGTTTSGAVFRLIINVGNGGPTFANGVTVTNDLGSQLEVLGTSVPPTSANNGAMVFLLGNLPPGFSTNIQVSARASSASGPTNLTAKAEVASYQADPEAGNNTAVSVVSIVPGPAGQPDLKVVILPAATAPHYCAPTVYSVGISNQSATAASGAMVTNWLPVQARYISAAASVGTVLHSPGMVILDLGVLPGHSSALLSVLIQPPGSGVLITRASIGAMDVDSNLADNVAFGATSVETPPEGAPFLIDCITLLEDGGVLLEFPTIPGRDYSIEYGTDLIPSGKALTVITATKDRTQWVDIGPPETEAKPLDVSRRFYRAVLLPQSP